MICPSRDLLLDKVAKICKTYDNHDEDQAFDHDDDQDINHDNECDYKQHNRYVKVAEDS